MDAQHLYRLQNQIDEAGVIFEEAITAFCSIYFKPRRKETVHDLEKLYTYLRFLLTKVPRRSSGPAYYLEDEVELQYYRLQKISEGQIDLKTGSINPLKGPTDVGYR